MPHGQYPEADQGKCRSCGFLSKHAAKPFGLPSPRFYEAEHSERITVGAFYRHAIGYREKIETEPMCFLGKINLVEIIIADEQPERERKLENEILNDRDCDGWYPYMPGLGPLEHYQDRQMRDYERKMEDERIAREASYRRQDRLFVIAALILAAGQILAAVIVSYRDSYADQLLRRLFGQ
jgi:hypothetical protein